MLLNRILPIFSLTYAVFQIHARVLLRSTVATAESSTSKTIARDLDQLAQSIPQQCTTYSSTQQSLISRDVDQLPGLEDIVGIQNNAIGLALGTSQPADASSLSVNQPFTSGIENSSPGNQLVGLNNIFYSQNNAFDQNPSVMSGNDQLLNQGIPNNLFQNTAVNSPANSPITSTGNIALGNIDVNNPSVSLDATVNDGLIAAISPALPHDTDSGNPEFDCVVPDRGNPYGLYTVWEMVFQGTTPPVWRWPHAILVADSVESRPPYRRYTVTQSSTQGLVYRKQDPYLFLQNGKIVLVNKLYRRGWLVPKEGEPKENALAWFEGIASNTKKPGLDPTQRYAKKEPQMHYTTDWAIKVFADLRTSGSEYWIQYNPPYDPSGYSSR